MVINTNDYICLHVENYVFLNILSSVYMMSQDLCDVLMTGCLPHDLALTDSACHISTVHRYVKYKTTQG